MSSGALVARSFERLLRVDPGFRADGVFTLRLRTPPEFFPGLSEAIAFQDRVQQALMAIPGVTGASAASALPLTATAFQTAITFPGAPGNTGDAERDQVLPDVVTVQPHFVETMRIRVKAGRAFGPPVPGGVMEAVIDSTLASRFFPGANPVGAPIQMHRGSVATVIGVIEPVLLYDFHSGPRPQMLIRNTESFGSRPLFFVMRTTREPHSLLPEVQAAVHRLDPRVPVGNPQSMDDVVAKSLGPHAMGAWLLSAFAAGAVLLAAMGLFGVVSNSVTRRRHELAVRLALGAEPWRVLGLVLKEGMLPVAAGLLIGAPGIYYANRLTRTLLVGVTPSDPVNP